MAGLVTLQQAKDYLEITDATHDALLQEFIDRLSAWVESYCGRTFAQAAYADELHDGDGTSRLVVKQRPIVSVASLFDDIDRQFGAGTQIDAEDFVVYPERGEIRLDGLVFAQGLQNVKVTYTAGFSQIPLDLQQAVIELIADRFRNKEHQGIRSTGIGAFRVDYDEAEIPAEVKSVLHRYRDTRIAAV